MSASVSDQDLMLLDRYLDGELADEARAACKERLAREPLLQRALGERMRLRAAFQPAPATFAARPGFADRIASAARRQPSPDASAPQVVRLCKRLLLCAAAVVAAALLWQSGLLSAAGPGSLQAAPDAAQKIIDDLDARIRERAAEGDRK